MGYGICSLSLEMLDKPDDVYKLPFHMYHETHEIQEKVFPITIEVIIEPQVHRTDLTKKNVRRTDLIKNIAHWTLGCFHT